MHIELDDLAREPVRALLRTHLEDMLTWSPPGSCHALDIDALREPGVRFWTAWQDDRLLGCAALKELDAGHGEVKSMRTDAAAQGRGVGAALLAHLMAEARQRGYTRLSLETGAQEEFQPARRLYARFGFTECPPFADYAADPASVFMTRTLAEPRDPSHHA